MRRHGFGLLVLNCLHLSIGAFSELSMTGISLHIQWPLTSQLHGSISQREQLFFFVTDLTPSPYPTRSLPAQF
jgi:hypothetical protein